MNKKIVIISNYYPPEMGAAANRIKNLAEGLKEIDNDITVICPLPNYPNGKIFKKYKNKFSSKKMISDIRVKRYWIYPSKSKNPIIRLLSMLSFAITLWFSLFSLIRNKPDVIIIQSPPLLVALSGLLLSKILFCKNILNVSDIWPLSALELGVINKGIFYGVLEKIEKLNYKLADRIMGQSEEILTHISKIVTKDFLVYRNVPKYKRYAGKEKSKGNLKIVYAGLLGYAQGILKLCQEINFKDLGVEFHIYGEGMDKDKIEEITNKGVGNIFFHGIKSASEIKTEIRKYDVGFVPLKNRIYGAVPSKIFELMQLGIPILYTCEGEAAEIIFKNKIGFFNKESDLNSLIVNILKFKQLGFNDYLLMSENCIRKHKEEYRLDYQLKKIKKFLNDENKIL